MKPFVVLVADLLYQPAARRPIAVQGSLDGLVTPTGSVASDAPVAVEGRLEWVKDGILFTGTVSAPWASECRRCLAPVGGRIGADVQELFWVRPTDGDCYAVVHESVDLAPMARESLLLELPLAALCSPGCAGLCPSCGADLNDGACGCPGPDPDPRWAALDALRVD